MRALRPVFVCARSHINNNLLGGKVPPLPFANYAEGPGAGACCLDMDPGETNHFRCPLPAGADKCKCRGRGGNLPGVTCK